MSRLPAPDDAWRESTEGDLDPDLAEESGSSLDDWDRPFGQRRLVAIVVRAVAAVVLVGLLLSVFVAVR